MDIFEKVALGCSKKKSCPVVDVEIVEKLVKSIIDSKVELGMAQACSKQWTTERRERKNPCSKMPVEQR